MKAIQDEEKERRRVQEAEVYRNGKTDIHRQKEGERVREGRREMKVRVRRAAC